MTIVRRSRPASQPADGVLVQDATGALIAMNARAHEMLGTSWPDLHRPLADGWSLIRVDGTSMSMAEFPGRRAVQEDIGIEAPVFGLRDPEGTIRWLELFAQPLRRDPADPPYAVVCTFRDVSAERAALSHRALHEARRAAVARPVTIGGHDLLLRASAGVVLDASAELDADELLQRADTALVRAKAAGKDATRLWDDAMRRQLLRRIELEAVVRRAVALGEVTLEYQPIVQLEDQAIVGAEALLRMTDEHGTPIPAIEVIEAAESCGSIVGLGLLILRTACAEAARWTRVRPGLDLTMAVNLSALQLADANLPDLVAGVLRAAGLEPDRLCLEITESVLMDDTELTGRRLAQLKSLGIHLSADDFGTGYSPLSYLKRLPLDSMKIDASFVAGLPDCAEDVSIVTAIMGAARGLGLQVVAEGIERPDQLRALEELGCARGQGHLWERAVPGDRLLALIDAGWDAADPPGGV
ncbi:MAG: hypothetical protein JWM05_3314 [Acidimicrobiales bacterium]|nr:hypothetical protein [Acidimicrobiales bacterium]